MYDLSVLIPARNEMFLSLTVQDILKNIRGKTEVIVVLDGAWANPPLVDDPRLTIIFNPKSIGQRAATNQACRASKAKYVMKIDAHCGVDEGFDVKMMSEMKDDYTMIPAMHNFHVFDWVCIGAIPRSGKLYLDIGETLPVGCGHRLDQGPTPKTCAKCGGFMERVITWERRKNRPTNLFYRFDHTMHFQYWGAFKKRPEAQPDVAPTLSAQGSCFMLTRKKYWELDICDEGHGSWGQQGTEVACKTWLSGGQLMVNKKTWYAHMFRTQGGDFGFPYPLGGNAQDKAREYSRDLWMNDKWPKAKHKLQWLLDKFAPVPDWLTPDQKNNLKGKGIIYYTDNQLNLRIARAVQNQLKNIGIPIISSSLKPMKFGKNIHLPLEKGYLTMAKQILAALEQSDSEIVFFCEHDVLYHPSHFEFTPPKKDVYYYNENVWKIRTSDGHGLHYDCRQLSGLCVHRELALKHFRERVKRIEKDGFSRRMGFEPGTHNRPERIDDYKSEAWKSPYPNVDIRHEGNMTQSRWRKDQFRNQKFTKGWIESKDIPGWGTTRHVLKHYLGREI